MHQLQICPIVLNWGTPTIPPKLRPGPCSSVGVMRGTDRHTEVRDDYTVYFTLSATRAECSDVGGVLMMVVVV